MDLNDEEEDRRNSVAWLSEQIFSELNEFNSTNCENTENQIKQAAADVDSVERIESEPKGSNENLTADVNMNVDDGIKVALDMPDLNIDIPPIFSNDSAVETTISSSTDNDSHHNSNKDLFEAEQQNNTASHTDDMHDVLQSTVVDTYTNNINKNNNNMNNNMNIELKVGSSIADLNNLLPLSLMHEPVFVQAVVAAASLVKEAMQQNNLPTFDPTTEEMKLIEFLKAGFEQGYLETIKAVPPTPLSNRLVKCANCNNFFNVKSFQAHICDHDEHQNPIPAIIKTEEKATFKKTNINITIEDKILQSEEPHCLRLLKENQIRIRRFIRDELKYEINSPEVMASDTEIGGSSSMCTLAQNNVVYSPKQSSLNTCTICEKKFVHSAGLLRHMEKHTLDLIPIATSTPKSSAGNDNKANIGQNNTEKSRIALRVVIKCILCGRIFFEAHACFNHVTHTHQLILDVDIREIDNCVEIPYDRYIDDALNILNNPIEEVVATNYEKCMKVIVLNCVLQCEFCDLLFSEVHYLFIHSAFHSSERRFECFACGIHVNTAKEITSHWQVECVFVRENLKIHRANIQRYFVCNVCEKKFLSLDLLHEHRYSMCHFFPRLNRRLNIAQLPCEYCEQTFDKAYSIVSHYEKKHYKKCKRDRDRISNGTRRMYLCEMCGKSYTQSSHLWQHLRFHQGVKPFACKEPGCSRKFTIRPDLNDHIRKCHTGERPYHCVVCDKRFLTGSVFYQHRLIHRGERRYECDACGKRFYRADALKNHQRIHTGEKPFACFFCTKTFRQRGDRDKHIKARHSHLDVNSLLMMQMQKIELENAAALSATKKQQQNLCEPQQLNIIMQMNKENVPPIYSFDASANKETSNPTDVNVLGNVSSNNVTFH